MRAVSPDCIGLTKSRFGIPLVMFVGDKDDANDAKVCEQLDMASGAPVQIIKSRSYQRGLQYN